MIGPPNREVNSSAVRMDMVLLVRLWFRRRSDHSCRVELLSTARYHRRLRRSIASTRSTVTARSSSLVREFAPASKTHRTFHDILTETTLKITTPMAPRITMRVRNDTAEAIRPARTLACNHGANSQTPTTIKSWADDTTIDDSSP